MGFSVSSNQGIETLAKHLEEPVGHRESDAVGTGAQQHLQLVS